MIEDYDFLNGRCNRNHLKLNV